MEIKTWTGPPILADDADVPLLTRFSWYVNRTADGRLYAQARVPGTGQPGRRVSMHRLLMGAPKGAVVHHRNNNGLDNRRANLELTTNRQNTRYAYEGKDCVHPHKQTGTWRAQVRDENGKRISLGLHPTRDEAVRAVEDYRGKS